MQYSILPQITSNTNLAPYASCASSIPFQAHVICPASFAKDIDQIIHSTSFRRLAYKTQVFIDGTGDHFRNRLIHSLEVARIARTLSQQLNLNEDLAEALSYGHDLGHSPFGHGGEAALNAYLANNGGFNHNHQTLRILTHPRLAHQVFGQESKGFQLSFEIIEGLLKRSGPLDNNTTAMQVGVFEPLWYAMLDAGFALDTQPNLEAQIAALADDIAYIAHDIEDGFRAGLFAFEELEALPVVGDIVADIRERSQSASIYPYDLVKEASRQFASVLMKDVIDTTVMQLESTKPKTTNDIRYAGRSIAGFSGAINNVKGDIKSFLFAKVYCAPTTKQTIDDAGEMLVQLLEAYLEQPGLMPQSWQNLFFAEHSASKIQIIIDYISGMTDRFALQEIRRLQGRRGYCQKAKG